MNELNLIEEGGSVPVYDDALHFDSTYQDKVNLPYSFYTGVRTLSTKFKPDVTTYSTYPAEQLLGQYLGGSGYANRTVLFRFLNGIFAVYLNIGNNYTYLYSNAGVYFNAGQWYDATITLGSVGGARLYIDGVLQSSHSYTGALQGSADAFWGGWYVGDNFNGTQKELRAWTTERTPSEVVADMTRVYTGSESGLKAYFPTNEGSGTTIQDINSVYTGNIVTTNTTPNYIDDVMWVREIVGSVGGSIEKNRIDLFEDQFVSITKQSFDVNNLKQRLSGVTNNFTLPFTANNSELFDYLDLNGNISNKPYQINYVEYIQDGTPIIKKGRLNLREISDAGYKVDVTHGINDFFDRIRDKQLFEPFASRQDKIDSMFAIKQVLSNDSTIQNAEGVVIPLVDYGFTNPVPEYQQSPFIIIKKGFDFIASDVGYTFVDATGGKLDDLLFTPNKLYEDSGELKELFSSNTLNGGDSVLISTFYTTKKGQLFREYSTSNTTISGSPTIELTMFADGVLINSYILPSNTTDYNVFQTFPTIYEIGTKIEIYVANVGGFGTTALFEIGEVTPSNNSTFGVGANTNVFYENLFQITQVEFIKNVFELFNLGMEVNAINKTIELYKLNDVYNPNLGNTIDFSDYYSNVMYKKFEGGFGKVNHFKYQYKNENEPTYDSSINANNINKEKDLISSDLIGCFFDRSIQLGSAYPYLLTTDGYDSADLTSSSKEVGHRIVKEIKVTTNPSVLYRNRNIPFGTFNQVGNQTITSFDGLDWSSLIEDNYSSLRDHVLNRYQEVKLLMRVPRHLIDSFSFQNKIFISQLNSKFVVQSIKTRPDGLSEWILIKLN